MTLLPSVSLRLSFDPGWTDGDPGEGRLRFGAAKIATAKFLYINARDADEARLSDLIPIWKLSDVLQIECVGKARVIAWIIGPVYHGGTYYKIPIAVRRVIGDFSEGIEIDLHHYPHVVDDAVDIQPLSEDEIAPMPLMAPRFSPVVLAPPAVGGTAAATETPPLTEEVPPPVTEYPDWAQPASTPPPPLPVGVAEPHEPSNDATPLAADQRIDDLSQRLDGLDRRVWSMEQKPTIAASESDEDEDLPAFLRKPGQARRSTPIEEHHRPTDARRFDIEQRVADLGRAIDDLRARPETPMPDYAKPLPREPAPQLPEMSPTERIASAGAKLRAAAPVPIRVYEAAMLARAQQEVPLALMDRLGLAMGCDWEAAATSVIRQHDAAVQTAVESYALEIEAARRIQAGEAANAVADQIIAAIQALGGQS